MVKRVTARQLTETFADDVQRIQQPYVEELKNIRDNYEKNIHTCISMDEMLGSTTLAVDSAEEDDEVVCPPQQLKDGSYLLKCPILNCKSSTFKLRRHLRGQHTTLNEVQIDFAVTTARKIEANKKVTSKVCNAESENVPKVKKNSFQNTNLVNRKNNYKKCTVCGVLCINISQHLTKTHKMNNKDERFKSFVENSITVPRLYIKLLDGKPTELSPEEISQLNVDRPEILIQKTTLSELKRLRFEIDIKEKILNDDSDATDKDIVRTALDNLKSQYKDLRYLDTRSYTPTMLKWKNGFTSHLEIRGHYNPKRGVTMALDVILSYQSLNDEEELKFEDIVSPIIVRSILQTFAKKPDLSSCTKLKYISMFELLLKYLITDIDSPEKNVNENAEQIILKDLNFKVIQHEIENSTSILSKRRGIERIQTNKKAKASLITEAETTQLAEELASKIRKVLLDDGSEGVIESYKMKDILEVRNVLMATATVRLGRRSQELVKMTLTEVDECEYESVNGEKMIIIKVERQKSSSTGQPAPIVYTEEEFRVLNIFINKLRPKLLNEAQSEVVFPPKVINTLSSTDLSLSSAWHILQKFETASGKKMTSRVLRASRVSNSRNNKSITQEQKQHLAASMNHNVATAERYYNYSTITNSVVSTLQMDRQASTSRSASKLSLFQDNDESISEFAGAMDGTAKSTPVKTSETRTNVTLQIDQASSSQGTSKLNSLQDIDVSIHEFSGFIDGRTTSTPVKMPVKAPKRPNSDADSTLQNLRSKKVKANGNKKEEMEIDLNDRIDKIVQNLKDNGNENLLKTTTGHIRVQPVTAKLPQYLRKIFCTNDIRSIIKNFL